MKHLGIEVPIKNVPSLDPGFLPLNRYYESFLADAKEPFDIAVERADGQMATYKTFVHGTPEFYDADVYYVERLVKTLLWMKGGFKVYISGDAGIYEMLRKRFGRTKWGVRTRANHSAPCRFVY